jgi:AcrR family transcriptional regulator
VGAEDPRISRTRSAVVRAATDLLVEGGPTAVTVDAIVTRSGVAKSTIYRHWTSRDGILVSVIESCAPQLPEPAPDLPVADALRQVLYAVADALTDPEWARVLPALLSLKHHEAGIAAANDRLEHQQDEVISTLLRRAVADGMLAGDIDPPEATAMLVGPLVFAHLTGSVPVDHGLVDRTLDGFVAAHSPRQ